MMTKNIIITGCAGFIGFSLCQKLLKDKKNKIIGIDILNNYYDVRLKKQRLKILTNYKNFVFKKIDVCHYSQLSKILNKKVSAIYHFAAQAGVQFSIKSPKKYMDSNVVGFFNILELSKIFGIKKIFYASSSSVYGDSKKFPVKENFILKPKNFYGLTKKTNEEMAEIFANYYNIKIIGLRFFTVYGPWGRPDLVIIKLVNAYFKNTKFYLNNYGKHKRDFTYILDVVDVIDKLSRIKFKTNHNIFNICSSKPIDLRKLLKIFVNFEGKPKIIYRKFQKGDILKSYGSNEKLCATIKDLKFTSFSEGMYKTIEWYKLNKKINT